MEEKVEISTEEKKQAYKDLMKYRQSKNCEATIEEVKEEAAELYEAILKELKTRKKPELVKSELDKTTEYVTFLTWLSGSIDESEGGKIVLRELAGMIERAMNNIEIRVETGFDSPRYTKLDMLKALRAEYMCIDQTIDHIIGKYAEEKKEEESLHPYEE